MFNIFNEIYKEIYKYVDEALRYGVGFSFPGYSKFENKVREGVVLYTKPKKNAYTNAHKNPRFDRRLMSKRIFTHTKK